MNHVGETFYQNVKESFDLSQKNMLRPKSENVTFHCLVVLLWWSYYIHHKLISTSLAIVKHKVEYI